MSKKKGGCAKAVKVWLFRMDAKRAKPIVEHLERKGIKQGPFFAEAALEKIARDSAQRAAA